MTKHGLLMVGLFTGATIICVSILAWYTNKTQAPEMTHNDDFTLGEVHTEEPRCLLEHERAIYEIENNRDKFEESYVVIHTVSTETEETLFKFKQPILQPGHFHPVELHDCHTYFARSFNYDHENRTSLSGYSAEIWRYDYDGSGESVVTLAINEVGGAVNTEHRFQNDFRVSPDESYIALERSEMSEKGYGLVIKSLDTLEETFFLSRQQLLSDYPSMQGGHMWLGKWINDGEYYVSDITSGMRTNGYIKVHSSSQTYQAWVVPEDVPGGVERTFNFQGQFAYEDATIDVLIAEHYQALLEEARRTGATKNLWIADLDTGERTQVATAPKEHFFDMKWIDDTTLEYMHPDGELKQYSL